MLFKMCYVKFMLWSKNSNICGYHKQIYIIYSLSFSAWLFALFNFTITWNITL